MPRWLQISPIGLLGQLVKLPHDLSALQRQGAAAEEKMGEKADFHIFMLQLCNKKDAHFHCSINNFSSVFLSFRAN